MTDVLNYKIKTCFKCNHERPLRDFYKKQREREKSFCKFCMNKKEVSLQWRMKAASNKAGTRNAEWDITLEQYAKLVSKPCVYCKGPLSKGGAGLDRLSSRLAYTIENVVPCCAICNWLKHDIFTYEEMKEIGALIQKFRTNRGLGPDEAILMPIQRYGYRGPLKGPRKPRSDKGILKGKRKHSAGVPVERVTSLFNEKAE